jgi:hypothetical protein
MPIDNKLKAIDGQTEHGLSADGQLYLTDPDLG